MTQKLRVSFSTERGKEGERAHREGKRMTMKPGVAQKRNRADVWGGTGRA